MAAFFRTSLLLAALTALFMAGGYMLAGQQGLIIALLLAGGMNLFAYWNSDRMVLMQYNAQEVDERSAPNLYSIVRELAQRAGMPMPRVYIMQSAQPNAFATGRNPQHAAVCASTGLLSLLDHDEVAGVMAHELSHILHRDTLIMTVSATLAGALGNLAQMAMWFGLSRSHSSDERRPNPLAALAIMILGPLAATLIQFAISRTREYEADRRGAMLCGNPLALARALAKISNRAAVTDMPAADANPASAHIFICNPLHGGGLQALFSTHPPMNSRIARLQAMAGQVQPTQGLPRTRSILPDSARSTGRARGPWG